LKAVARLRMISTSSIRGLKKRRRRSVRARILVQSDATCQSEVVAPLDEAVASCHTLKFPGQRGPTTPCMTVRGLQRLLMILGGKAERDGRAQRDFGDFGEM
jgi:hypothetical protein